MAVPWARGLSSSGSVALTDGAGVRDRIYWRLGINIYNAISCLQHVMLSCKMYFCPSRCFGWLVFLDQFSEKVANAQKLYLTKSDISWFNRGCECFEAIVWIVFAKMNVLFLQLLLLSSFLSTNVAKKSKSKSRKKNERASLLGLTDEYSTFELPFKYSPNLIKIGNLTRNMNSIKLLIKFSF